MTYTITDPILSRQITRYSCVSISIYQTAIYFSDKIISWEIPNTMYPIGKRKYWNKERSNSKISDQIAFSFKSYAKHEKSIVGPMEEDW
mmetsp:Transcript_22698/g.31747  ORF Transcript_22698/g.31747 Transcript_22698/m.31747 type:complete len:89 (+) Transcript_22698:453-719(+)